jgi:hypothetical protein
MARRIADLLVRYDPAAFANAAQLLSRDQRMLDRLRALGTRVATRLAPQARHAAQESGDDQEATPGGGLFQVRQKSARVPLRSL